MNKKKRRKNSGHIKNRNVHIKLLKWLWLNNLVFFSGFLATDLIQKRRRALSTQSFDRHTRVWLESPGVLFGLLMQYPCGRIKPSWIGQLRFALLPGDERGGGGALWTVVRRTKLAPVERTLWICVVDLAEEWPSRCSIHNVGRFLDAEEVDGEIAPFLSASVITRCYRSGFQSSISERQRERSSRSPRAAPL